MKKVFCSLSLFLSVATSFAQGNVSQGHIVPNFSISSTSGHTFDLMRYVASSKKSKAVFFFCGCSNCHDVAKHIAEIQQTNPDFRCVVVFSSDCQKSEEYARAWKLFTQQNIVVCDPDSIVTRMYKVDPCPRVFVVNRLGVLQYTNRNKDDSPLLSSSGAIIARRAFQTVEAHALVRRRQ